MRTIVVRWEHDQQAQYVAEMRVVESDHKRFAKGSRFDYGFFDVATNEGYTIILLPKKPRENKCRFCGVRIGEKHRPDCSVF